MTTATNRINLGSGTLEGPSDLRVRNLSKSYGDFSLRDVSMAVPQGMIVGLIGRNGAGKTTLMKCILGATLPDAGDIELFGQDIATLSDAELAHLRERVCHVSATIAYPQAMTTRDVAQLYQLSYPRFDQQEFERLCAAMGLDAPRRKVSELSRGMGMKLQLACALATNADLLILDEPTAGLDPIVRDELLDILRAWMEPGTHSMLISSHITSDLEHLADYLVMIDDGQVVLDCERDVISDVMGVASLRSEELQRVLDTWPFEQMRPRVVRHDLSWALLVPDRTAFQQTYPDCACDRATIDDVMTFVVKGELR